MLIGQGRRIGPLTEDTRIWEEIHLEIIALRDEENPELYSRSFARRRPTDLDKTPSVYVSAPLKWQHKLYYGLDYTPDFR